MIRTTFYLTMFAAASLFFAAGCEKGGAGSEKPGPDDGNDTIVNIPDYDLPVKSNFTYALQGKRVLYDGSFVIPSDSIDSFREDIWNLWKDANNEYPEEKLAGLGDLSSPEANTMYLPQELEPNSGMPYYYGVKGASPAEGYPLFVYMHGSGDKNSEWSTGLRLCQEFDDAPSAYFIPQIPNTDYYRWWLKSKQYAWEKLLRLAFVAGDIDPLRVYFFGISEGGYGSQRLASFYADYLAAAGPMAGGEPLRNAPVENCANIAFSLRTGSEDTGFYRNELTESTGEAFDLLEAAHPGLYVHKVELEQGSGHIIDYYPTAPWMSQYGRNPYPKYVAWEDFDMDGAYRKGFYNIEVLERANDGGARTFYVMSIDGNTVNMTVENVTYTTTETDPYYGIELDFDRSYSPTQEGRFIVYLSPEMVDFGSEVILNVNGSEVFRGMLEPDIMHIVNSCSLFFDPARLFPAAIEVDLSSLQ
ncbi:MAG TPA: hypothetical protein IAC34_04940 [Candidatus Coprenecus stercoripullorum]|nr:hypothetical protein [Candidatus Coprenecus stercoripullorum]